MNLLELFSGIGGFSLGLQQAGFTFDKVYFSEIDRHAIANFKHNFPNAQHVGSVCDILQELPLNVPILSLSDRLARISALLETALDCKVQKVHSYGTRLRPLTTLDLTFLSGKMLRASSSNDIAGIFGQSSRPLPTLGFIRSNGNCLILHGYYPKIERESTLSGVLQKNAGTKYFLSAKVFSRLKRNLETTGKAKIVVVRL